MKKIVSAIIVLSLSLSQFSVFAKNTQNNSETVSSTVSGYVSATSGDIEIASKTKTPGIYVDENDYEGVVRAVGDLKSDIKAVTKVTADISNDISVTNVSTGVVLGNAPTLTIAEDVEDAQGIIAVYKNNGALSSVQISKNYENKTFTFDNAITAQFGETVKGMVWSDDGNMRPLTPVYGEALSSADISDVDIIVGTLGKSDVIDALADMGKLDVSGIGGQWEAFTIQNIDGTLVIAGADKRGTIYGVYDLCEKMGVSPWEWWADVTPQHSDAIYVTLPDGGYTEGSPSVKYRGVFLNQEYNLNRWSLSLDPDGEEYMSPEFYEKIFELLLRLKANYLWPAMHDCSPAFNKNPKNAENAEKYGIVMGASHCEILLRNNVDELKPFQDKWIAEHPDKPLYMYDYSDSHMSGTYAYDYTDVDKEGNKVYNKEFMEDYWRERVRANKDYESNFTIGLRGVHDGGWSPVAAKTDEEKIALQKEAITKQREILSEELGKPASEIPQTYIPYKDIAPLYEKGLKDWMPKDVTIVRTNDNYGHIRQCFGEGELDGRSGGGGLYYHVSYFGNPTSVIWNSGTQLGLIKEEMTKAYMSGADTVWMLNVGPLKGFENQMEYFLDLGRNIDTMRDVPVNDYVKDNARRYFGFSDTDAAEYADIQTTLLQMMNSRRPEFQTQGIYSITSYGDEGQKELDKYADLLKRSTALYDKLGSDLQPAFYELQLYALKCANSMANNMVNADKSVLYKAQQRGGSVNKYKALSDAGYGAIKPDTDAYNTMLDGKWNKAQNPFQTSLYISGNIMKRGGVNGAVTETVSELPFTEMGIAVENQEDININPALEFSGYTKDVRFIDIFNKGTGSFNWTISADADWIVFNKESGTVYDDDRIYAGVDWSKAPTGKNTAKITVTEYIKDSAVSTKTIDVTLNNNVKTLPEKTYAEANGYVSIEAEHYTRSVASNGYEWIEQDDFGRSGTSMKFMPNNAASISNNSAYLEYDVNFDTTGTFDIDVYRMPTLNEGGSVNFSIGADEAAPTVLKGTKAWSGAKGDGGNTTDKWAQGVLRNSETLTATVKVETAGIHKIRLYGIDTGAVVDKIVITAGEKHNSYSGAPESYNTTYNNQPMTMPEPKAAAEEITGDITPLFTPTLYTVSANIESGAINSVDIIKLSDAKAAKLTAAAYDNDGIMLSQKTVDYDFTNSGIGDKIIADIDFAIPQNAAEVQIIAYDENLNALSPAFVKSTDGVSLMAAYDNGIVTLRSSLDTYKGKEAICKITDENGDIAYIRQESIGEDTFKTIKTEGLDGTYDVNIGIAGNGIVASEKIYTATNITTDTPEKTDEIYSWDFSVDNQASGGITPTLGGKAVYDGDNKAIRLLGTDGTGNIDIALNEKTVQGQTITVVSKIAYGRQDGKYTDYVICDTAGKELIKSHICAYSSSAGYIEIGGVQVKAGLEDGDGIKTNKKDNLGINNGYSTYTTVLNPDTKTITLTVSNAEGTSTYTGKFPENSSLDLGNIKFSTSSSAYASRSSYVDDISVSKTTAASYTINFDAVNGERQTVNANVTVKDAVYNTVISPNTDGTYNLCDGIYEYTIAADGYKTVTKTLELSPATLSKTIEVIMEEGESEPTPTPTPTATPTAMPTPTATPTPTPDTDKSITLGLTPDLNGAAQYNGKINSSMAKALHSLDNNAKTALASASVGDKIVISFDAVVEAGNALYFQPKSGSNSGTNYILDAANGYIETRNGSNYSASAVVKDKNGSTSCPADTVIHIEITMPLEAGGNISVGSEMSCVATYTDTSGNVVEQTRSGYGNYNAGGKALTGFEVWCRPNDNPSTGSTASTATISNASVKLIKADKAVALSNTLGDNMLIQRGQPIKITGTALGLDGKNVTVTLTNTANGADTQSKTASVSGTEWFVTLDKSDNYTDTYTMTVAVNDDEVNDITVSNIIFGDLYLCGGQSNMWKDITYYKNIDYTEAEYKQDRNNIRILNLNDTYKTRSAAPCDELPASPGWTTLNQSLKFNYVPATVYSIATKLADETDVPIGVLATAYAGTNIHQWLPTDISGLSNTTNNWFNTRIYPFRNMAINGIFYYQGEQDRQLGDGEFIVSTYTQRMKWLIEEYRELFNNENLPFYYVAIPRVGNILDNEGDEQIASTDNSALSYVRQAQTDVYLELKDSLENFGIVPSLDIYGQKEYINGAQNENVNARVNFHPGQKPVIADRLVSWALKDIYGKTERKNGSTIYTTGPVYKSSVANGNKIIVNFDCAGDLKVMDTAQYSDNHSSDVWTANGIDTSKIQEFEIAGEDGVFYRANAVIGEDKKSVELTNANVGEPVKVRYAFSGYGADAYVECPNLTDDSGLPSLVFSKTAQVAEPTPTPTAEPTPTPTPEPTLEPVGEYDSTADHWLFDFGANTEVGYYGADADTSYTENLNYGFIGIKTDDYKFTLQEHVDGFRMVQGQKIELSNGTRSGSRADSDFVAVTDEQNPIRFAMSVQNGGYYHVKVTLANASDTESANITLFTEKRHLLLENKEIEPGGTLTYEFNVDVETFYWKALNGKFNDDTISIGVSGKNAAISSMEVTKLENNGTTLWVLSDSTGCDQPTNFPYFNLGSIAGVGQALAKYLPADIALSNQGDGGLASNDTTHYACAKDAMKAGDYLYIEYGHNDTSVTKYAENLQKYYNDCHNAGVKMIVVGPIDRCQPKQFNSSTGEWSTTLKPYSDAGKQFVEDKITAGATDIAFVGLNASWIEFLNETTQYVTNIRNAGYESDSVYYYYRRKPTVMDTTHINEAGADRAAYIFFTEAKNIVDAAKDENANASVKKQAAVLADLVDGMRNNTPYTVSEEIVRAGKVGANSFYPEPVYETYDGYEATIRNAAFDNGTLKSVTAKIEHYTGFDKKDIPYALAIAELYDESDTLIETYQSTTATKYDATNANGTFTLLFDDADAVMPEGGSYKIWLQGMTSDNELMIGDEYRVSDYYTPASVGDNYLIGDLEDIETPDTFSYYGIKTGSDLSGNNGWCLVGSSTKSATLEKDSGGSYARLSKSTTSGSYVLYRAFETEVKSSKIVIDTDLYYESGYMRFILSNKTNSPNSGYSQRINSFTVNNSGKILDSDDNVLGDMPANEWTHITYEFDMDYGTQKLTVGNEVYDYTASGIDTIIPSEVTPSSLAQLNISGSSYKMSARIKNISLKNTVQETLPDYTLTLTEPDAPEGTVAITGTNDLTLSAKMNSEIDITAEANEGYAFVGWYEGETFISAENTLKIRLHRDVELTAKFEETEVDTSVITWNFSQYSGDDAVPTTSSTYDAEYTVSDTTLELHLGKGDSISADGLYWSAKGTSDSTSQVSNNRYIKFTPTSDGVLKIIFRAGTVDSNSSYEPRLYYAVGTDLSCTVKNNVPTNPQQYAAAKTANADTELSINVTSGNTYYIWTYIYIKKSTFTIPKITFTPDSE